MRKQWENHGWLPVIDDKLSVKMGKLNWYHYNNIFGFEFELIKYTNRKPNYPHPKKIETKQSKQIIEMLNQSCAFFQ